MIKLLSASAVMALSLSACVAEVRPDHHGKYRSNDVIIERNSYEYHDGYPYGNRKGYHCPPGQAKKGRCQQLQAKLMLRTFIAPAIILFAITACTNNGVDTNANWRGFHKNYNYDAGLQTDGYPPYYNDRSLRKDYRKCPPNHVKNGWC